MDDTKSDDLPLLFTVHRYYATVFIRNSWLAHSVNVVL